MHKFQLKDSQFLPHIGCDIQLLIQPGEALVLVGENGIGKSTLMRRYYQSLPDDKRSVVEQKATDYFFDRKLSVLKNIFLTSEFTQFNQGVFLSLWRSFNLEVKENRLLSELSGGETQALKICLSLAKDAPFYFLDEPSQYLDHQRKKVLAMELEQLRVQHRSLVLIEHDQDWLSQGWRVQELAIDEATLKQGRAWTI